MLFRRSALLCTAMIALAGSATVDPQRLTFSVFEPPQAFGPAKVSRAWVKEVSQASNGTIDIEMLLAGSQFGTPQTQLELVQNSVADLALIIPSFTPGRFPGNKIAGPPSSGKIRLSQALPS